MKLAVVFLIVVLWGAALAVASNCTWTCNRVGNCTYCYSSCNERLTCCDVGSSTYCY
jgi:hypothetical protein